MAGLDINGFQFRPGQAFYPGQNYELHMTGFGGNPSPYILGSDGQFYVKIQSPVNATPYSLQNREMTRPAKFSDREISRSTSAEIERRDSVQDPNSKKKPFTRGIEASVLVTQQNWRVVKDNVNQPLDGFNEYVRDALSKWVDLNSDNPHRLVSISSSQMASSTSLVL